jgi:hypothetical protein
MAAAPSSGTKQRFTLDDSSFEKLLAAAWVLQCLHDQLHPPVDRIAELVESQNRIETASLGFPETIEPVVPPPAMVTMAESKPAVVSAPSAEYGTLAELVKAQEAIETGMLDLDATVKRLVSLSPKLSSEPAALQSASVEPIPVKVTAVGLASFELTPRLPTQPPAVAPPAKPSRVWQKPPNNKRQESHASSFNRETTRNRLRDVVARYRATFRDNSTLRTLRAVIVATPVNLQTTLKRLRGAGARYRAALRLRTEKALATQRSSLNLGTALKRLQNTFTHYESRFRVNFTLRSLRAVAIATPVWLLAVIANLLLLETWLHEPFRSAQAPNPSTAEAAVTTNSPTPIVSTRAASQPAKKIESTQSGRPAPFSSLAASHEQITDLATSSVVQQLSRYEINGLRRQAKYGDDAAAFTLGMAYELGRHVHQNCVEAARWVTTAAEAGNAAAQYNLGLRYRDGDGVSADLHESEKWLRKAAAHRNPEAKLALQLLASR